MNVGRTYPWRRLLNLFRLDLLRLHNLIPLDKVDLGHRPNLIEGVLREPPRIAPNVPVIDVLDAALALSGLERVFLVRRLEEVEVVGERGAVKLGLQEDDVRVVDGPVGCVMGGAEQRCKGQRGRAGEIGVDIVGISRERRGDCLCGESDGEGEQGD